MTTEPSRWIIVPIDGRGRSRRAIGPARDLARRMGAGVRLLSLVDDDDEVAERSAMLKGIAADVGEDLAVDLVVTVGGEVEEAIIEAAGEDGIVCMSTSASLLPHEGHFGSIAEEVVRTLERPVVLVGPHADPAHRQEPGRVVVPIDGSALSETAIAKGAAVAKLLDVPMWLVTVVSPKAERKLATTMHRPNLGPGESSYVRALASDAAREYELEAQFELLHLDDPADAILDFANPDGVVVMTTHGRTGLARLFAGSVATEVVARAEHPVFVLRPDDALLQANG